MIQFVEYLPFSFCDCNSDNDEIIFVFSVTNDEQLATND